LQNIQDKNLLNLLYTSEFTIRGGEEVLRILQNVSKHKYQRLITKYNNKRCNTTAIDKYIDYIRTLDPINI